MTGPDEHLRELAAESLAGGDPTGWFERLYVEADGGTAVVPWDQEAAHWAVAGWADERDGRGRGAVVVGCALGRDAEHLAKLGFDTVAFDIAETAVRSARERHAGSPVRYEVADLLELPAAWLGSFDLVVESLTVQALPVELREAAIAGVRSLVAPGGTLLVIAYGQHDRPEPGPPWPLSRAEVESFAEDGLRVVRIEQLPIEDSDGWWWRAEFSRPMP